MDISRQAERIWTDCSVLLILMRMSYVFRALMTSNLMTKWVSLLLKTRSATGVPIKSFSLRMLLMPTRKWLLFLMLKRFTLISPSVQYYFTEGCQNNRLIDIVNKIVNLVLFQGFWLFFGPYQHLTTEITVSVVIRAGWMSNKQIWYYYCFRREVRVFE
jgi:hypothetical protein